MCRLSPPSSGQRGPLLNTLREDCMPLQWVAGHISVGPSLPLGCIRFVPVTQVHLDISPQGHTTIISIPEHFPLSTSLLFCYLFLPKYIAPTQPLAPSSLRCSYRRYGSRCFFRVPSVQAHIDICASAAPARSSAQDEIPLDMVRICYVLPEMPNMPREASCGYQAILSRSSEERMRSQAITATQPPACEYPRHVSPALAFSARCRGGALKGD